MAVTFVRSGLMMPGKFPDGQTGRIAMVTKQDSVAEIENVRRQIIEGALPPPLYGPARWLTGVRRHG